MFSFLNLIGQGLGYIGFFSLGKRSNRILNQIFITIGILGDLYLFHLSHRFFLNLVPTRGWLLGLIAVGLAYLLYLNVFYFFLGRQAPFDFTPRLEKTLGLHAFNHENGSRLVHIQNVVNEGHFLHATLRHGIPANVKMNPVDQQNLRRVVHSLIRYHQLQTNYDGLKEKQIARLVMETKQPVFAIGAGMRIPAARLSQVNYHLVISVGQNAKRLLPVGHISSVAGRPLSGKFLPALKLQSVILVGGPRWCLGRSRVYEERVPYQLLVNVCQSN